MLVESLIAVRLPSSSTVDLPTPPAVGIRNLLLEGRWTERCEVPAISPAATLARLHRALKTLPSPEGRIVFAAGATEPFDTSGTEAPFPDEDAVPDGWSSGLAEGTVRFGGRTATMRYVLRGRLVDRVRLGEPGLRLVLRGVWADMLPDGDDPAFEADVASSLGRAELRNLREWLLLEAQAVTDALRTALQADAEVEVKTSVMVIEAADGLDEILAGFPDGTRRALLAVGARFATLRPMIDVVSVRQQSGKVREWRGAPWLEEADPTDE